MLNSENAVLAHSTGSPPYSFSTGGTRLAAGAKLAASLGHNLEPATPSLFTFKINDPRIEGLAGLSVDPADVHIQQSKLRSSGPVLITHWGLSGPGILKISSWGARELAERNYAFDVSVNWLPGIDPTEVLAEKRQGEGKRQLASRSPFSAIHFTSSMASSMSFR